jgi:hypothetical protein
MSIQAALVAVVGTGLGIGVGVFLAGLTIPSNSSDAAASNPAVAFTTSPDAAKAQPQPPSQTTPAVQAASNRPAVKQASAAKVFRVAEPLAASQPHQPRLVMASLTNFLVKPRQQHELRHPATLATISVQKPKPQPPVEEANEASLEIPDGRFQFTIEGDQTEVAYDAQSGVVSTDGSGSFVVEKASGEVSPVRPQEASSNVHYKCDQDANCSMSMDSLVVQHARMRAVSHSIDWASFPTSTQGQAHDGPPAPPNYVGQVSR